jgi:nucleotide-binding universal stress UspA family protein
MFFHKILVPLDGSRLAEEALPHAVALAELHHGTVSLLRVAYAPYLAMMHDNPRLFATVAGNAEQQSASYLRDIARRLHVDAHVNVSTCVESNVIDDGGDAATAERICAVAASLHVDVIVMSTHGRSGVRRMLLGSVADRVVHAAAVPVLLVRATHA